MFETLFEQVNRVASTHTGTHAGTHAGVPGGSDDIIDDLDQDDITQLTEELFSFPVQDSSDERTGLVGVEHGWRPSMADTVLVMRAQARLVAHHQARLLQAMNRLVSDYHPLADGDVQAAVEGAVAEIRCALSMTRRSAESHVDLAWRVHERLPAVGTALFTGDIDLPRARALVYGTDHLDQDTARRVTDRALERAAGSTAGQLRALVRRLCVEADPDEARQRYQQAVAERRVVAQLSEDGTGTIIATDLPPDQVAAAMNRIDRMAQQLNAADESRSTDQLRADVFLDLLTGGINNTRAVIDLTVDLPTLAELADRPADLGGMGPVISDIARHLAAGYGTQWRYAVTDSSGNVLVAGTTKRRPTTAIRRAVELRDRTCVFPGCRRPATQSDLDHTTPYSQDQNTSIESLAPCCRHDHVTRHRFDWTYTRNPDRSYTWTAPSGRRYTRPPPDQ